MKKTIYTLFLLAILLLGVPCQNAYAFADNVNVFEQNAFRIARKSYADGHISLSYIFPLNTARLKNAGFSDAEVTVYRFYLMTYVNALAKSNAEKVCEGVRVESGQYFTDVDGIGFSVAFENLDAQKRFFGVTDDSKTPKNNQHKSGFFVTKTSITTSFPISNEKSAGDLKLICLMAVSSWATNSSLSKEKKNAVTQIYDDSIFVYDFATQTRGLKSEVMYEDENFVHNVFSKTLAQIKDDPQITFWVTSINTPVWYLSALVVVGTGMVGAWVAVKVVQKKKKSRKK